MIHIIGMPPHVCDTGAVSDKAEHTLESGVCTVCNALIGTQGLAYTLSSDGTYYIVSGMGTAVDTEIIIPSEHNGLPVVTIGDSAFNRCDTIISITIPDTITFIGGSAFYWLYLA